MILLGVNSETYNRLNKFVDTHNLLYPNVQLTTAGETIDFLIQTVEFYQTMVTEEDIMKYLKKQGIDEMEIE